jgi:hypothetical protein
MCNWTASGGNGTVPPSTTTRRRSSVANDRLDEKDKKKVAQQLKEIRAFLKELEDAGIEVSAICKHWDYCSKQVGK